MQIFWFVKGMKADYITGKWIDLVAEQKSFCWTLQYTNHLYKIVACLHISKYKVTSTIKS